MRFTLLNPGPVNLSDGVRKAAVQSDLCHREPEYLELQDRVRSALIDVYALQPDTWTSVLLGGSGTTALEAMVSSLVPRDGRLLVIENGICGERISRIAEIHAIGFTAVRHGWTDAVDLDRVEKALEEGSFTHVAAAHHETTAGRLNDAAGLAGLCESHGVKLLLDGGSSFGAEDIPFGSPALVACAATANKCLHGIPGLCFVICRRESLQDAAEPPRSLYMHLPLWAAAQDEQGTPFTPSVNGVQALQQALRELAAQGGWRGRHANYSKLARQVKRTLAACGVNPLLEPNETSCVLSAYRLPVDRSYESVHGALKQRGFIIYAGQGSLAKEVFRISTMGDISSYDMERLLAVLHDVFSV